jgi:UPF0716 protein FxsA
LFAFRYLPVFLLAGFILEIASIIWVGGALGVLLTLLLLIAGGAAGISVLKSAGTSATAVFKSSVQSPGTHTAFASATLSRVMAGLLLIIPGFFSDLAAVLLLLPPIQKWLASKMNVASGFAAAGHSSPPHRQSHLVIEGEAMEIEEEFDAGPRNGEGRPPL